MGGDSRWLQCPVLQQFRPPVLLKKVALKPCGVTTQKWPRKPCGVTTEKWQFVQGPGGLEAYYDSLFHELSHFTELRLGRESSSVASELRAEIAAPSMTAQL